MIFISKMKNLKIYKTPVFLPTLEDDKKRGYASLLLTPNYESSKKIMTHPLLINRLRYSSYYIEKGVSFYINGKNIKEVDDSVEESSILTETFLSSINEDITLNTGDKVMFFNEESDSTRNLQLKNILYKNRIRKREEILSLYETVKKELPFIKYTFPDLSKYQKKNIFVDLYYYNKIFFENNSWISKKGMILYNQFMDRLINNPSLKSAGYNHKTIFIPITDWDTNPKMWDYRESLNPISIIYQMMFREQYQSLNKVFSDNNIIFLGNNCVFKINFSEIDPKDIKKLAITFKLFLIKIMNKEEFDLSDIDTTSDNNSSPDVIKANIIDKIEAGKGIDLTSKVATRSKANSKNSINSNITNNSRTTKTTTKPDMDKKEEKENISKATLNKEPTEKQKKLNASMNKIADAINNIGDTSKSEDDAWDELDNDDIKKAIMDIDNASDDGKPDINDARAARITELDKKLMDSELKGKSIKDILEPKEKKEDKVTTLELSSPNEEWKELKFTNFDKNYNIDKDIINCFRHFEHVSRPMGIRNMNVRDNSTSEDRVELYEVDMEDYRGSRFTVRLDIPTMVDNRFLLRGYNKSIQTQRISMPITKTDANACQIVSNYMKIFVRRFGSSVGKSLPTVAKFVKAATKYTGRKIKFSIGDNSKVCNKYELPVDYIDLASKFNMIETDKFIIYFNQDELRNLYQIEEGIGIPYLYNKSNKEIVYYSTEDPSNTFINCLINLFTDYQDFIELYRSASIPTVCMYSRCSIMETQIPLIVICAYHEGLRKTLDKAMIEYHITSTLGEYKSQIGFEYDYIKFKDGYVIYKITYESSLLMNGLKDCPTSSFEIAEIDNRNTYLEFLDSYGGRVKADGLDNFYDLMIDPITEEILNIYKLPTDYVSVLLYANALLADNKFNKHTNISSNRLRRYELIAAYTYKVLADAYNQYAYQLKNGMKAADFIVKQSAVIDKFLTDTISSDDSCINALRDVETTNSITTKGPSGMNSDRAYGLDKRTYDDSMLNVLGMSTGFAGNVGITRQATIDANVEGDRGFIKSIEGDTSKMNTAKSLTITEALTPFGSTRDDPMRTAMTYVQTAKHMVRTEGSDPLLVTNGSDEALAYLTSDKFAFKSKKNGIIKEMTDEYIIVSYEDDTCDYINIKETIEKNSDGGYYVPLKLDPIEGLKVGDKVKENQILAYDKYSFSNSLGESENIAYNVGKLAKVAIINSDEGFEDSGIITQKMANQLATRVNLKADVTLDKATEVISMAKVGDNVEAGDNLIVWQSPFDDEEANALLKSLSKDEISELGKRTLKSHVTGKVTDIKIYRTIELDDMSDSLKKIVNNYEIPLRKLKKKLEQNNINISNVPAHYSLPANGKLKKAVDSVVIEFYVEYLDTVGVGDKIVYFSANKATEKSLIPLGKEPYTAFRPNESIDAFVSQVSIDKRMVSSTVIYGSLQKLMIELDRSIKDIMEISYDDSKV